MYYKGFNFTSDEAVLAERQKLTLMREELYARAEQARDNIELIGQLLKEREKFFDRVEEFLLGVTGGFGVLIHPGCGEKDCAPCQNRINHWTGKEGATEH